MTTLTESDQKELARKRADHARWSAVTDTSSWDSTFYLRIIDRLNEELRDKP